jgi:hypothetical protein
MITKLSLAAALAWAACSISYATPADAIAYTAQSGEYATCSSAYVPTNQGVCWDMDYGGGWGAYVSYRQQIRFVDTGCNTGGTCAQGGDVWTDFRYTTGRKPAYYIGSCDGLNIYDLGACDC